MQLQLHFAEGFTLPLAYRHYVQSMLYHALRSDEAYSTALHDEGNTVEGRSFKLFTFGQLQGSYTVCGQYISFPRGASLEVRSIYDELILRLLRFFTPGKQVRLGSTVLTVAECTVADRIIRDEAVHIRTSSPIVAYITREDSSTYFFCPEEPEFYAMLVSNAKRKWSSAGGEESDFVFSVVPDANCRFRKQVTLYKSTRITAWDGKFRLEGTPQLLTFLYNTGLGAKSSQGFGMFQCIGHL